MRYFQDLRKRRVPQIVSSYIVGGWGLLQFLEFLEGRMTISSHLVNLIGLGLLLLLPAVIVLAWSYGRPGDDRGGRLPKIVLPANLIGAAILLAVMFSGKPLGAVTQTIAVQDEDGTTLERVVPRNEFRRRLLLFYPENSGDAKSDWARETFTFLVYTDLTQDVFLDVMPPYGLVEAFKRADSPDGHGLSNSRKRKIARDSHYSYFSTSSIRRVEEGWRLEIELHDSENGRVLAKHVIEAKNLYELADSSSLQLRRDLQLPAVHIEESKDLPVEELSSENIEAVKLFVRANIAATHHNDWAGAAPPLEEAVALDPGFTNAQFLRFAVNQTIGKAEVARTAIQAAMENLYRVDERSSFLIKSQYYFDVAQDPDKAMAVLDMWSRIYPSDITAQAFLGLYSTIRNDLPAAIAAYERILEIDPSQYNYINELAKLHRRLGEHERAEEYLQSYIEIFPSRMSGYEELSDLYIATGQLEKARTALEEAQLLEPGALDIILGLVDIDLRLGNYAAAREVLDREIDRVDMPQDRSKVFTRLMMLTLFTGQAEESCRHLDSMSAAMAEFSNPLQVDIITGLTLPPLSRAGQPEAALERLEAISARIMPPFNQVIGSSLAQVLTDLGRIEEARAHLAEAEEIVETLGYETLRPVNAFAEGRIAEYEGDLDRAADRYRFAWESSLEKDPAYSLALARVLRLAGENDESREILDEALRLWPGLAEIHLELALVLESSGKLAEAREHLRRAGSDWTDADAGYQPALQAAELAGRLDPEQ